MMVVEEPRESAIAADQINPPTLPVAVLERLRLRANHLKMLPAVATQALDVAKNPDCAISQFVGVVETDPSLAADILRISNSILFGGSRKVLNLQQAVVRLGFRQCKNLILASSFSSMMKKMSPEEEAIRENLWRHSYVTALVALNLNRALNAGYQGEEFAGGLIHDIGRMLVAVCYPGQFQVIDRMTFDERDDALDSEENAIQTNHCEIGAWFCQKNGLPEALADGVRFHHAPERSREHRRFVALIAASDHLANHLQRGIDIANYDPTQNRAVSLLEEYGIPSAISRFAQVAPEVMETACCNAMEMFAGYKMQTSNAAANASKP